MTHQPTFTRAQKQGAAQREAERRARHLPKLVAQREIEIMQEIDEDYAAPARRPLEDPA